MSANLEFDILKSQYDELAEKIGKIDTQSIPALVTLIDLANERFSLISTAAALYQRMKNVDPALVGTCTRLYNHAGMADYGTPSGYLVKLIETISARKTDPSAPMDFEGLNEHWPNAKAEKRRKLAEGWIPDGAGGLVSPETQYRARLTNVRRFGDRKTLPDPLMDEVLAGMRSRHNWPYSVFTD